MAGVEARSSPAESTSPATPTTRSHFRGDWGKEIFLPIGFSPGQSKRGADSLTTATASGSSSLKNRPSRRGIPRAAKYSELTTGQVTTCPVLKTSDSCMTAGASRSASKGITEVAAMWATPGKGDNWFFRPPKKRHLAATVWYFEDGSVKSATRTLSPTNPLGVVIM